MTDHTFVLCMLALVGAAAGAWLWLWIRPNDNSPIIGFLSTVAISACLAVVLGRDVLQ